MVNISVNFFQFGDEAVSFQVKLDVNELKFRHLFQNVSSCNGNELMVVFHFKKRPKGKI